MSRRQPAEESLLFDLPLDRTPTAAPEPAAPAVVAESEQPGLPLKSPAEAEVGEEAAGRSPADQSPADDGPPAGVRPIEERPPGRLAMLRLRAIGGVIDLAVLAAVLIVLLVLLLTQGVRPGLDDWPAGALFLLTFSFLYSVLPLAFWGQTPGMALANLRASTVDGRPLTFRQAVSSWLGSVLTVALGGLPLLLALGGRSLSDRISGSITRRSARP